MLFPVRYADGRKRVRRLHALGYAGRSPCRCFSPVLIRKKKRRVPCAVASISRKPTCWLAIPTGLKVTPFPSVLQLLSESCRTARSTNHIPSQLCANWRKKPQRRPSHLRLPIFHFPSKHPF